MSLEKTKEVIKESIQETFPDLKSMYLQSKRMGPTQQNHPRQSTTLQNFRTPEIKKQILKTST